jgi:hypothetical protein
MPNAEPVFLDFGPDGTTSPDGKNVRLSLSAIALSGDALFVASDETTRVERLIRQSGTSYANHTAFQLAPLVGGLPMPDDKEIDLEGLDVRAGYLWAVGSHSMKRKAPEPDKSEKKNRERLETAPEVTGNRYFLARIPLDTLAGAATSGPTKMGDRLTGDANGNELSRLLAADKQIGPFLAVPGKENGLDIEGLAVTDTSLFVGLRGPVLRGWAVIVELPIDAGGSTLQVGTFADGAHFRKHYLNLNGLGVRDLCVEGENLLVLAGPTMVVDAPEVVIRWPKGARVSEPRLLWPADLQPVLSLPPKLVEPKASDRGSQTSVDHAEGIAIADGGKSLLVVYDAPDPARLEGNAVTIDRFGM